MIRITALFVLLVAFGNVLCGGGKGGGRKGMHAGKGMMGMMGLGKEADAVMCKPENMLDDKFDQFRTESQACGIDECAAQADDISAITKPENQLIARMHCSEKYKTCLKEKFSKGKGGGGDDGASGDTEDDAKKDWKEKWAAKKDCIKTAFEKVFGPIGA